MTGARRIALWISPPLLGLLLYWGGLTAWFQKDDFAWLGLPLLRSQGTSLAWVLFAPLAQGTIRTLSERIFFLSFTNLFGLNPLPFRVVALLTFMAATVLLQLVATRLTGSRAAGWWAAMLWTVNAAIATPLAWTAVYYQMLCALFFLLDTALLLRYIDTGKLRFLLAQWATFLLGFFVLEINVVYPAIATVLVLCIAPRLLRQILPMFLASAVFMAVHFWVAPLPAAGPYKLYWDGHIVQTLLTYVNWSFGTGWLRVLSIDSSSFRLLLALLFAAGLAAFLVSKLRRREWIALLFPAWFVIALAPVLPLRFHMMYEYLTVPTIGLALWGGAAIVNGWAAKGWKRASTLILVQLYLAVSIPVGLAVTASFHDRSFRIRNLFRGVESLTREHPDRKVLLKGVNTEILNDVLDHRAFRLIGVNDIYVVPEDEPELQKGVMPTNAAAYFISPQNERRALSLNRATVYGIDSKGNVADITSEYKSSLPPDARIPSAVQIGDELDAGQLGPTWYGSEGHYRWMPKHATVTLHGPGGPTEKLYLSGFGPRNVLEGGPVHVSVSADGEPLGSRSVMRPDSEFELSFDLPAKLTGKPAVVFELELDKTFHAPGDVRELGSIFSMAAVR
jgi:hypothetical protein